MKLKHIKNQTNLDIMRVVATYNTSHQRFKRRNKRLHKQMELRKTENWQKTLDEFKRNIKKKGVGRVYKIKGQKLKSYWDTIDRIMD